MKGGIFIDTSNKTEAFTKFIENSNITFLSKGSNGFIFVATLRDNNIENSFYKSINPYHFKQPVTKLIIKICIVSTSTENVVINDKSISPTTEEDFMDEINIQTDVFLKTISYLQPICPAIVFSEITENNKYVSTLLNNYVRMPNERTTVSNPEQLFNKIINDRLSYGIIGMEFAYGYQLLYRYIPESNNPELILNMDRNELQNKIIYLYYAYYILIELAIMTGYHHGDFHSGNILINNNDNTYFTGFTGSIFLIDYGLSKKIPPNTMKHIKKLYKIGKYSDILTQLCAVPLKKGIKLKDYPKYDYFAYEYVCNFQMIV